MNIDTKLENKECGEIQVYNLELRNISFEITTNHPDHLPSNFFSSEDSYSSLFSEADEKEYVEMARRTYEHSIISEILNCKTIQKIIQNNTSFDHTKQKLCLSFDYGNQDDYLQKDWYSSDLEPILCEIQIKISNDVSILDEVSFLNDLSLYKIVCYAGCKNRRTFAKKILLDEIIGQTTDIRKLIEFANDTDSAEGFCISDKVMSDFVKDHWLENVADHEILRTKFDSEIQKICNARGWHLPRDMNREFEKTRLFMDMFAKIGTSVYYSLFQKKQFPCCIFLYAFLYEVVGFDVDRAKTKKFDFFKIHYLKTSRNEIDHFSFLAELYQDSDSLNKNYKLDVSNLEKQINPNGDLFVSQILEGCKEQTYASDVPLSEYADVIAFSTHGFGTKDMSKIIGADNNPQIWYDTERVSLCNIEDSLFDSSELDEAMFQDTGAIFFASGYIQAIGNKQYALGIND